MKRILIALAAAAFMFVGCTEELELRVDQLEQEVTELQSGLDALKAAVDQKLTVTDYNQIEGGYELLMSDGNKLYIYNGADGAKGDKGDKGETGAQGPQGEKGDKGETGAQGPQGEKGDKGETGAQGPQGEKGDKGETGAQGEKGEPGDAFFKSVEAVDGYLVITLVDGTVYQLPLGNNFNIIFTLDNPKIAAGEAVEIPYTITGAAESDHVVVRILFSSNCEAAVLPAKQVVSITPALGEGYVDLCAINNTTGELKAKTISFNGSEIFEVSSTVFYVSPLGGNVEVPVTTSADYELTIDGSWLTYVETRAVREETIVLSAVAANTAANDNVATVTMKSKTTGKELASFQVTQKNYYPEWIEADGKLVEWEESFKLYKNAELTGDAEAKKGVFTFELSDDFTKGVYKVKNLFYADLYFHNSQMVQNQGGEYYADVEGDVLTVYYAGATLSYGFTSDVKLAYDATEKTFSAETIATYSYATYKDVWMVDYAAAVKVDAPAGGEEPEAPSVNIAGTWNQTVVGMSWPAPSATMTITVDGSTVTLTDFVAAGTVVTATFENNQIIVPKGTTIGAGSNSAGPLDADVVLTLEGNTFTAAPFSIAGWVKVSSYSATNPDMEVGGGEEPEPVLTLAVTEAEVAADATSYEVALTANVAWEATATEGVTVTPATGEGDATVALAFAANEETSPVTHTVTVTAGELTATLTLTQAAAEPKGPQAVTVTEFLALSVGTTEYQLTGVMEGTYNTTYGNFYLNDGTDKVLVYGLTATKKTSNDRSFASLGLKDGDTITIIGTRAVYNGTAQVGGPAYLVSCEKNAAWDAPAISFVNNIVTLVSNEGAAIYYTIDGTTPSESSLKYSEPFEIQETVTVNAVAVKEGRPNSSVATKECEYVEISDDVVVGGAADFATISATNTSYVTGKTTAGWNYKNCAIFKGGTSDSSPAFKMIGDASNRALCMNGKTSAVGSITSPTLTTGCGTLTFNYGLPFSDTKIKFRVDIMQNGSVVKTFTINNASATKLTKYSHSEAINVSGDFQIVFTNLSPSNSSSNKDRTAIWDVEWTGYAE